MTTTINAETATLILTAEGYNAADVLAAIDSLIEAGLTVESDNETVLTDDEMDLVRDQLNS